MMLADFVEMNRRLGNHHRALSIARRTVGARCNSTMGIGKKVTSTTRIPVDFLDPEPHIAPKLTSVKCGPPAPDLEAHLLLFLICTPSSPAGFSLCIHVLS
jgi:hypothetical protein